MLDETLQLKIAESIIKADTEERANRTGSDRLTASMLGNPLQWQVLKMIGVPPTAKEEFVLRKFQRGRQVEDWFAKSVGLTDCQKDVEYKGVVGKVDGFADTKDWRKPAGIIPVEVKSVTNMKFKYLKIRGADASHKLQGALYALAEGKDAYAVVYCASDDFRVLTYMYPASFEKQRIDQIITRVSDQLAKKIVPVFEPEQKWQANDDYNNYLEWRDLTKDAVSAKLQNEYPESYKKLQGGVLSLA